MAASRRPVACLQDRSGAVDSKDFSKAVAMLLDPKGTKYRPQDISAVFSEFDKDKSGQVSCAAHPARPGPPRSLSLSLSLSLFLLSLSHVAVGLPPRFQPAGASAGRFGRRPRLRRALLCLADTES